MMSPKRLTTPRRRMRRIAADGVTRLFGFTREFLSWRFAGARHVHYQIHEGRVPLE